MVSNEIFNDINYKILTKSMWLSHAEKYWKKGSTVQVICVILEM